MMATRQRNYSVEHIDEDIQDIRGFHENELFFNCVFRNLRGVTLKDCVLDRSKVLIGRPEDILGLTITLDCHTFSDVELSETVFDLLLLLLIKSKGNIEKRRGLVQLLGEDRVRSLLCTLKGLE